MQHAAVRWNFTTKDSWRLLLLEVLWHNNWPEVIVWWHCDTRKKGFILSLNFTSLTPEPLRGTVSKLKCYCLMFSTPKTVPEPDNFTPKGSWRASPTFSFGSPLSLNHRSPPQPRYHTLSDALFPRSLNIKEPNHALYFELQPVQPRRRTWESRRWSCVACLSCASTPDSPTQRRRRCAWRVTSSWADCSPSTRKAAASCSAGAGWTSRSAYIDWRRCSTLSTRYCEAFLLLDKSFRSVVVCKTGVFEGYRINSSDQRLSRHFGSCEQDWDPIPIPGISARPPCKNLWNA